MPLSVSFTLVNLLPLFKRPFLYMCEYIYPVSHLTDTCPACANGRTFIGALDEPSRSADSHAVCSSVTKRPSFQPSSPIKLIWPAIWLTQSQIALKSDGYIRHRIMTTYMYMNLSSSYINSNRSDLKGWADRAPSVATVFRDGHEVNQAVQLN